VTGYAQGARRSILGVAEAIDELVGDGEIAGVERRIDGNHVAPHDLRAGVGPSSM
jgi:hypothetical protein